ncbi:hypothetical protein CH063_12208 [Colletotrichum higginsianum]|uniref:Uncharacterized protein n=1 Tax=Colletotrichum higginsianum (strain IMI 349063) TaxID=759273 RepID=H1VPH4_COLHI|nr:hypothetical protein CH063_12208 [Colletotrichum higginsianum]
MGYQAPTLPRISRTVSQLSGPGATNSPTDPWFLAALSSCHSRTGRILDAVRMACSYLPIRMARLAGRAYLLCMGRAIANMEP